MFQNHGLPNVGMHNHCFEQTVDIITNGTGQVVREKVFGLFIENVTPQDFFLVFGSGAAINLFHPTVHLPVVVDNPQGEESNWVEPWGQFSWYWLNNVDISNNLTGELYLQNASGLFIYNGLKECIYLYYNGHFKIINKFLPVEIRCPVLFPENYCRHVDLTGGQNILHPFVQNYHYLPELSAAEYLRRRAQINRE
jgi:hypothetical protein